jgi:hypothetical protein
MKSSIQFILLHLEQGQHDNLADFCMGCDGQGMELDCVDVGLKP